MLRTGFSVWPRIARQIRELASAVYIQSEGTIILEKSRKQVRLVKMMTRNRQGLVWFASYTKMGELSFIL